MVGFLYMTRLQKLQALYVDAYVGLHHAEPPKLPASKWESESWLNCEVNHLAHLLAVEAGREKVKEWC